VHLSAPLRLSVRAYSARDRRAGGVGEAPDLPYPVSRSQSVTPVNDARPWKLYTPPDILVRRQCVNVMYVLYAIRYIGAESTALDIKAHTPLVVDLLYNKLCTCRGCCGFVVGVLYLT